MEDTVHIDQEEAHTDEQRVSENQFTESSINDPSAVRRG